MEKSTVYIQVENDNFKCSYAIIDKYLKKVIIILKDMECVIYDYDEFINDKFNYLLLKYYDNDSLAYKDFMKLIGKMCKKNIDSKYFSNHINENNEMHYISENEEYMIDNSMEYIDRKNKLIEFIKSNKDKFTRI